MLCRDSLKVWAKVGNSRVKSGFETGIETFDSWVLISRLESRLLKFESWYRDWNWDYQILSLDIETGIETFEITVLISRLVSRQKKRRGSLWSRLSRESLLISGLYLLVSLLKNAKLQKLLYTAPLFRSKLGRWILQEFPKKYFISNDWFRRSGNVNNDLKNMLILQRGAVRLDFN